MHFFSKSIYTISNIEHLLTVVKTIFNSFFDYIFDKTSSIVV